MRADEGGLPPLAPNAAQLPHALRRGAGAVAGVALPLVVLLGAGLLLPVLTGGASWASLARNPIVVLTLVAAAIPTILAARVMLSPAATLYPDRIEARGLLRPRVLRREAIQGFRTVRSGRDGPRLELVAASGQGPSLLLPLSARADPVMADWLAGAPDIAAQARDAYRASVLADPRHGPTPQARAARLALAKAIGIGLIVAGGALAVWLLLRPFDVVSLVAACMALLAGAALGVAMEGLFAWLPSGDGRAPLAGAAIPPAALSLRMATTSHLVRPDAMVAVAAVCAVGAGALAFARAGGSATRGRTTLGVAVLGALLGYGGATALDIGLDPSSPSISEAAIVGHRVSHGRRSTTWYLRLDPSPDGAGEVSVPRRLWEETSNGDLACVARHPGALGVAWFTVDACAKTPG